jgi:hypothetical protein
LIQSGTGGVLEPFLVDHAAKAMQADLLVASMADKVRALHDVGAFHGRLISSTRSFAMIKATWRNHRRRARRLREKCAYDLCASKERCPECGTALAAIYWFAAAKLPAPDNSGLNTDEMASSPQPAHHSRDSGGVWNIAPSHATEMLEGSQDPSFSGGASNFSLRIIAPFHGGVSHPCSRWEAMNYRRR